MGSFLNLSFLEWPFKASNCLDEFILALAFQVSNLKVDKFKVARIFNTFPAHMFLDFHLKARAQDIHTQIVVLFTQ